VDEESIWWMMYKEYLKAQPSKIGGNGTFTTVTIPAGVPIMEITGPRVLDRDIEKDYEAYLQIGPNSFLGLSGDVDDYINHSCDPNCRASVVGNRAILFSLYVIPAGAELTFDWSTTSTDTKDKWKMDCKCGSNKCRGVISGFQYLDGMTRDLYIKKNMVPLYITNPGIIQKK
jgi:hypothetical protein